MPWWGWLLSFVVANIILLLYACLRVASKADERMEEYYHQLEKEKAKKPTNES